MFQGLRTLIFRFENLEEAKVWYSQVLNKNLYFDEPFYVGFNISGFELGLHPYAENEEPKRGTNIETYLGVEDLPQVLKHCLSLGATLNTDIQDVGVGIQLATVHDPFGNLLDLINNPNFKYKAPQSELT